MSRTQDRARQAVTVAVFIAILIAAAWSIANIAEAAKHYHQSAAASLIGLAFGLANAISVYVLATARSSASRRPAIVGTIVFSVGSAAIQFHLYTEILLVATGPAFWFATLGPATEAILAWMEAGLHKEAGATKRDEEIHQLQAQILDLEIEAQQAGQARQAAQAERDKAVQAVQAAQAAQAHQDQQEAKPATRTHQASQDDSEELTPREAAKVEQIIATINGAPAEIWTPAAIADANGWSLRTAQRYIKRAAEVESVTLNGDGGYHAAA